MKPSAAALPKMAVPHVKPEPRGWAAVPREQPIDLVHLSRQTFGDKRLETELLRLFMRQSEQIRQSLGATQGGPSPVCSLEMLHMLSGSARVVGATAIAALAGSLEGDLRRGVRGDLDAAEREALSGLIRTTNGYVTELLDQT